MFTTHVSFMHSATDFYRHQLLKLIFHQNKSTSLTSGGLDFEAYKETLYREGGLGLGWPTCDIT